MNFPAKVTGIENVRLPDSELHLAIGMFDGVHLGHQSVIQSAIQSAREGDGTAGVLTFWPHPSSLFRPEEPVPQIMTPDVKDRVLESLGINLIIEQPFNPEFASIPAEELVVHLRRHLPRLTSIHVGENWRFGKGRKGDAALLRKLGEAEGVRVISAPRLQYADEPISSTRIRGCLSQGEVATANALLGYNYFSEATVQGGRKLGRTLGFPTLNFLWNPPLKPRFGVYAVWVGPTEAAGADALPGVANYGVRPTVESTGEEPFLEVFILQDPCPFSAGDTLRIEWLEFLRPETRFAGLEELKAQIARDVEKARAFFSRKRK